MDRQEPESPTWWQKYPTFYALVQIVVSLTFFGIVFAWNWQNRDMWIEMFEELVGVSSPVVEDIRSSMVDCDKLAEEHLYDLECALRDDCVLTRDELKASAERSEIYDQYCRTNQDE